MLEFTILKGSKAGVTHTTRHFPVRIGRESAMDLQLLDEGVFGHHCTIALNGKEFSLTAAEPSRIIRINGETVTSKVLKPGDEIDLGGSKLRFSFVPTTQHSLAPRELITWAVLILLPVAELAIIRWLLVSVESGALR